MIKIIFEVSEDFIRENGDIEVAKKKMESSKPEDMIKIFADSLVYRLLKDDIEEGKTEFIVTPDRIDGKSLELYNQIFGTVCALAHFSLTDKVQAKEL